MVTLQYNFKAVIFIALLFANIWSRGAIAVRMLSTLATKPPTWGPNLRRGDLFPGRLQAL